MRKHNRMRRGGASAASERRQPGFSGHGVRRSLMQTRHLWKVGLLFIAGAVLLAACGGGNAQP